MFLWNNKKYLFSILNPDTMEKFDAAEKKLWGKLEDYENEHASNGRINADGVKEECKIMDSFFDGIFGKGTAKDMFGTDFDLSKRVKATKKLYNLRNSQLEEHESRVKEISELAFGVVEEKEPEE